MKPRRNIFAQDYILETVFCFDKVLTRQDFSKDEIRWAKDVLVYAVASAATMIAGLFIGLYFFESDVLGVALFSIAGATFYVLLIVWVFSVAYRRDKSSSR